MFDSLKPYNVSLSKLKTGVQIDLIRDEDRAALLTWLNEWGCRHLPRDQHGLASASILHWCEQQSSLLPSPVKHLWELDDHELAQAADAYSILAEMPGAKRESGEGESVVRIGFTAASKVLFALRPEALAPWDDEMRKRLGFGTAAKGYLEFLKLVRQRARSLAPQCEKNDFVITDLPARLKRDSSSVVALLNEHLWVTISADVVLPTKDTLAEWASW